MTDRQQTDHATEKCVGIGGIACTARASLPNEPNWVVIDDYCVITVNISVCIDCCTAPEPTARVGTVLSFR